MLLNSLPNSAAVFIHHGGAGLAVEGLLKFRHIRNHAVGAIFFWRVRVDGGAQALRFVAALAAPALAVADEEALVGRESVDRVERLALGVGLPCRVGENQSAEVGNIFAERKFAVDLNVVNDGVAGILV